MNVIQLLTLNESYRNRPNDYKVALFSGEERCIFSSIAIDSILRYYSNREVLSYTDTSITLAQP